jgi:hypothetical protein
MKKSLCPALLLFLSSACHPPAVQQQTASPTVAVSDATVTHIHSIRYFPDLAAANINVITTGDLDNDGKGEMAVFRM